MQPNPNEKQKKERPSPYVAYLQTKFTIEWKFEIF